ncbi:uncharacterized protein HD556DRAFT_1484619 [Suillus plorans]|uniref:Uncharacterized protein n=1 Tax=Suillus plorans TaxID=116603 RepID=A0A9P7ALF2_9AGAM|nr:uncharacterized protein HD556DRAFT_1484619 [Suillus plorans]KAG1791802.1 hypothetical protein HD556DRAFT_1484619 [Suillus plorans]
MVKHVYRQLLRVFAHIYHAHYPQILHLRSEPHFNSLFAHFLAFGPEYELLDIKDVKGAANSPVSAGMLWEKWREMGILDGKAKEVQGHRHLLTFVDGPRTCLGKDFAITEFKTILSVLVKNFVFEMRDGPDTPVEVARGILPRPQVVGECHIPRSGPGPITHIISGSPDPADVYQCPDPTRI